MAPDTSQQQTQQPQQERVPLEARVLSEIYFRNDGRPGSVPVSPGELSREFKRPEADVLAAMKGLRLDGYLSRPSDANPLGAYADRNSFFDITDKGIEHYEGLRKSFAPDAEQDTLLDAIKPGQKTLPGLAKAAGRATDSASLKALEPLLDELVVYGRVERSRDPLGGGTTYSLRKKRR